MFLNEMELNEKYLITSYGDLSGLEIEELNKIGFLIGEEVYKSKNYNCINDICMFNLEDTMYSINKKYVSEIEVTQL